MKQGTAQFYYCCDASFTKQFKALVKTFKKGRGQIISLTEEPGKAPDTFKRWGFHLKCLKKAEAVQRCTVQYEVYND